MSIQQPQLGVPEGAPLGPQRAPETSIERPVPDLCFPELKVGKLMSCAGIKHVLVTSILEHRFICASGGELGHRDL